MNQETEIVQMALKLMEIEYTNWNICLEHCPTVRSNRYELSYYIQKVKEGLKEAKADEDSKNI